MNLYRKYLVLSISLLFLGSFSFASWETDTCVPINLDYTGCNVITKNYKKPYCFSSLSDSNENDYMKSCIMPLLTNNLSSKESGKFDQGIGAFDKYDVLKKYCFSLLGEGKDGRIYFSKPRDPKVKSNSYDNWDWQQTFDSHQSLFVYALCSSFKQETRDDTFPFLHEGDEEGLISDVFTGEAGDLVDIIGLQQMIDGKNRCNLDVDIALPNCDLSIFASKIYTAIMTDLFKIKYAQIFHVNTIEGFDENEEERILDFFRGYFNMKEYSTLDDLKKDFRQVVDVVKTNQEYHKNVLKNVKIIDNSRMVELVEKSECPLDEDMVLSDFVACALHGSQGKRASLEPSFVTLVYNEMLHYRLFVSYLSEWANMKEDSYQSEALNFRTYSSDQLDSTQETLRDLEDMNMTYPLHIGLLLYQERMKKYRDSYLSKIVTLFYSLSEKLQNVQLTA